MPAIKLNQRRVDALKPRKSAYDVRDRDLKGFGLRVWPSGQKRYFIHSQHGGRHVWKTIASAECTSAGEARAWAATKPGWHGGRTGMSTLRRLRRRGSIRSNAGSPN